MRHIAAAILWVGTGPAVWLMLDGGFKGQAMLFGLVSLILSLSVIADNRKGD